MERNKKYHFYASKKGHRFVFAKKVADGSFTVPEGIAKQANLVYAVNWSALC